MGSQLPPEDGSLPFGFAVDPGLSGLTFSDPPEPMILSPAESRWLSQFMAEIGRGNTDWAGADFGEGLNFASHITEWYSGPQVLAHSTTLGPPASHQSITNGGSSTTYEYIAPSSVTAHPHPSELNPSADVLAAATALSRPNRGLVHMASYNPSPPPPPVTVPTGPPLGSVPQYTFPGFGVDDSNGVSRNTDEAFINEMVFGEPANPLIRRQPAPEAQVQYGSDPTFNRPCFQPRTWNESLDGLSSHQTALMECFQRTDSAAPTRASSPVLTNTVLQTLNGARSQQTSPPARQVDSRARGPAKGPAKKRKTSEGSEGLVDKENPASGTPAKRNESFTEAEEAGRMSSTTEASNGATPRKRRRSAATTAAPRAARENLTEAQRRANHIKSEQKRRGQIQEGFGELKRRVPGLGSSNGNGNNMSKATMLERTGDWLEALKKGNIRLQAQLDALLEAEGLAGP